jgi:colicin import membrane protein
VKKLFFFLLITILYGCTPSEQITKLEDRVAEIENRFQNMGGELSELKNSNEQLLKKLDEIDKRDATPNISLPSQTEQTSKTKTYSNRCKAITKAGTQCKRSAQAGSDYCWQHQGNSTTKKTSSISSSNSDKTIHTGPRGGHYYINKNGNKTYIRKK